MKLPNAKPCRCTSVQARARRHQFSESFKIDGGAMFAHACKVGLEGVVSKVRDSVYPVGRSNKLGQDPHHRRLRPR
jgi:ATP-dependent DNA ligase